MTDLRDTAETLLQPLADKTCGFRNSSPISGRTEELRIEVEELLQQGGNSEEVTCGLQVIRLDCACRKARWEGSTADLSRSVRAMRPLVDRIAEIDEDSWTLSFVRSFLGNNLIRLGYQTRSPRDLNAGTRVLEELACSFFPARDQEHLWDSIKGLGGLKRCNAIRHRLVHYANNRVSYQDLSKTEIKRCASALRDLGDGYIGSIVWSPGVCIDGAAIAVLRVAVMMLKRLKSGLEHGSADRRGVESELFAAKSSLAYARAFVVHEWGSPRRRFAEGFLDRKGRWDALFTKSLGLIKEIQSEHGHMVANGEDLPFRWARTLSNVGFAAHMLWRVALDKSMRSEVCEDVKKAAVLMSRMSVAKYSPDDHRYRSAINIACQAALSRDEMFLEADQEKRKQKGGEAMRFYAQALRYIADSDNVYRRKDWLARIDLIKSAQCDTSITSLPDLWDLGDLDTGNRQEEKSLGNQFAAAASAAEVATDKVAQELESELAQARRFVPSGIEDRQALVDGVERAFALGLVIKVDGEEVSKLDLQRGRTLTWILPSGGALGFRKHAATVRRPGIRPSATHALNLELRNLSQ